jgi:hypothetical protein
MFDREARLRELGVKAQEGTIADEEIAELAQLAKSKQQARGERLAQIAGLRQMMRDSAITISDLFSSEEINGAAAQEIGKSLGQGDRSPAPRQRVKRVREAGSDNWVRQKSGLVLVEVRLEGANGFPSRYCKGESLAQPYVAKSLKQLDDGQLESNLERHYTEEGRRYFSTEEGKVELARLINFIKARKVKPKR